MSNSKRDGADASTASQQLPIEGIVDNIFVGFTYYAFTSLIAVLGTVLGYEMVKPAAVQGSQRQDLIYAFAGVDGPDYANIAVEGYHYSPETHSPIVFFPAYPLLGRFFGTTARLPPLSALLILSHICLAGTFIILAFYAKRRFKSYKPELFHFFLLAFGLFPTTMFFRMTYSESLFLFCSALVLYAIHCHWSLVVTATIVGFATATRPVGVALIAPLTIAIWDQYQSWGQRVLRLLVLLPLAAWGLAAYMVYLHLAFHDALAFAKNQQFWHARPTLPGFGEKLMALITLEPIWSVFTPSSPCFWRQQELHDNPVFSLVLANPVYFVATIVLVLIGACIRLLTRHETALAVFLLAIPYVTRSYEMCMISMGRFSAVVIPAYIVLSYLLARLAKPLAYGFLMISSFFLGVYAALFAAGHYLW